ncbi:MAG: hypothetical protein M3251_00870 [Thermoproteota archaeon]|nr:hypothetical protein [Thermoproteota archaeon]
MLSRVQPNQSAEVHLDSPRERAPGRIACARYRIAGCGNRPKRLGLKRVPGVLLILHLWAYLDSSITSSRTNVPLYPKWQQFLREHQPKTQRFYLEKIVWA